MANSKSPRPKTRQAGKDNIATGPKESVDIVGGTILDARIFISVEKVSPGSGAELLNMAKKEQEHRHSLENQLVSANIEDMRKEYAAVTRGQWFAFLTTLGALGLSTFLIMNNYSIEGSVLGGSALALVVASFIRSGKRRKS